MPLQPMAPPKWASHYKLPVVACKKYASPFHLDTAILQRWVAIIHIIMSQHSFMSNKLYFVLPMADIVLNCMQLVSCPTL